MRRRSSGRRSSMRSRKSHSPRRARQRSSSRCERTTTVDALSTVRWPLLAQSQILVGPMTAEELRRRSSSPRRGPVSDRAGLTDALVGDVAGRPGGTSSPVHRAPRALAAKGQSCPALGGLLTLGWRPGGRGASGGGLRATRSQRASSCTSFTPADGRPRDRRRGYRPARPLAEFDLNRATDAARALAVLVEARLVVVSDEMAEVAHEAVLREWPRLRDWLEEDAHGRRLHRHLTQTSTAWDEGGRDEGRSIPWRPTYHGARLGRYSRPRLERPRAGLRRAEAGPYPRQARRGAAHEPVAAWTSRWRRGSLVLSLIVGGLALRQRDEARAAAAIADARHLAARSLVEEDDVVSVLLAREAVNLYDAPETRSALLATFNAHPRSWRGCTRQAARRHSGTNRSGSRSRWTEARLPSATRDELSSSSTWCVARRSERSPPMRERGVGPSAPMGRRSRS